MRLYERFGDKGFHTSVATTFSIDFDAYESIALSRLRGAGCRNNLLLVDSRALSHALSGGADLPQRAGTAYTVNGIGGHGVFHPKLILQFGRKTGRLILGSANMTPSGLAGNLELVGMLECDLADSGERQLIAQAWRYAQKFIDFRQRSVFDQVGWMQARTGWLDTTMPAEGIVQLRDGTSAAFLASGEREGIAQRFTTLVDQPVRRLIVVSPYWDPSLSALSFLARSLRPRSVSALVDPDTREFPKDAARGVDNLTLYDRSSFREGRFIHAKAIIAQTENADHVLFGSANCTNAALGGIGFSGINDEACLYRKLPAGSIIETLSLDQVLLDESIISCDDLHEPDYAEDLTLSELTAKNPGTFEGQADSLVWRPTSLDHAHECTLTMLGKSGQAIDCELTNLSDQIGHARRFQIKQAEEIPAFARVTYPDGSQSAPTIITWTDALKLEMREPQRSSTKSRLDDLERDTEAGLALLEIMNELEELEKSHSTPKAPVSIPKAQSGADDTHPVEHRTLSYEEFVAGRRPRAGGHELAFNSLAGSDVSIVRGVLNRIIGFGAHNDMHQLDEDHSPNRALSLGDETEDGENAINAGREFSSTGLSQNTFADEALTRRAQRRRATQGQLVKAVADFQERIRDQQNCNEPLTNYDLVRLRALIMILAAVASPRSRLKLARDPLSMVRVLPVEGDHNSWPMLIGRLLFTFFGGKNPAIRLLYLKNEHDQVPGDFSECWATCYWAFQACTNAPLSKKEKIRIKKILEPIAQKALLLTLPSKSELLSSEVTLVIDKMSGNYAGALGIKPNEIMNGHRDLVSKTFV